jgi:hypothetical protein
MFVPTRDIPEPSAWETRENYNARTEQDLDPYDWFELVAASVLRKGGVVTV